MFRSLAEPWLKQLEDDRKGRATSQKILQPLRSCNKGSTPKAARSRRIDFSPKVERFGESDVGSILRHSIYGGNDDIVQYTLSRLIPWPLTAGETLSCLRTSLLMARDDIFLQITRRAGSSCLISKDHLEATPLMMAARFGRMLLVNILLMEGADPCQVNCEGKNAFDMAFLSQSKDTEFICLRMLRHVSDIDVEKSILGTALYHNKFDVARYLINCRGHTTLYISHLSWRYTPSPKSPPVLVPLVPWELTHNFKDQTEQLKTLEFLLSEGLDVNAKMADNEETALHIAASTHSSTDVTQFLLNSGACANAVSKSGATPLFLAVKSCLNQFQVPPLLSGGASFYCSKASTFNTAVAVRRFQIVALMLLAGYCPNTEEVKSLADLGNRVPEQVQILISSTLSEARPLSTLSAFSLREGLCQRGIGLSDYLNAVNCPNIVRRFINFEHLVERLLDSDAWNALLKTNGLYQVM